MSCPRLCQLAHANSLREICQGLAASEGEFEHLGAEQGADSQHVGASEPAPALEQRIDGPGGHSVRRPTAAVPARRAPAGSIPLSKRLSPLPIIVDPSHGTGDWRLVPALARAALALDADGIIVEVHEDPDAAVCDGPQSLQASQFAEYAAEVAAHAALLGRELA